MSSPASGSGGSLKLSSNLDDAVKSDKSSIVSSLKECII